MNDFELLYYCLLRDDYAHDIYYSRFSHYLLGIIHRCVADNHEAQRVYEQNSLLVNELLMVYQPIRCANFKAWFSLCAKRAVVRTINTLRRQSKDVYSLDRMVLNEAIGYTSVLLIDRNDPQYMDALRMKIDVLKYTVDHELSATQRKALAKVVYEDKESIKAKPKLKNGLHHAKSKIYASLKRHR